MATKFNPNIDYMALVDDLRMRLKSNPFKPFAIRLDNGRLLKVPQKDVVFSAASLECIDCYRPTEPP